MRKTFFGILILLSCTSCTSIHSKGNSSQDEIAAILKIAKNVDVKDVSRWSLSGSTVSFKGGLVKGDCQLFIDQINGETTSLKVNSSGGGAFEGLCIANEMIKRNFDQTIVNGICVSSCANYLFLASRHRTIENGIVGYHGNITALLRKDPSNQALRQQLLDAKVDPREIERVAAEFMQRQKSNSSLEQKFLRKIGVSQDLFERTQAPDKGTGDGKDYTFLLPLPETFLKYGILNVVGSQNIGLGQAMGMTNLLQ